MPAKKSKKLPKSPPEPSAMGFHPGKLIEWATEDGERPYLSNGKRPPVTTSNYHLFVIANKIILNRRRAEEESAKARPKPHIVSSSSSSSSSSSISSSSAKRPTKKQMITRSKPQITEESSALVDAVVADQEAKADKEAYRKSQVAILNRQCALAAKRGLVDRVSELGKIYSLRAFKDDPTISLYIMEDEMLEEIESECLTVMSESEEGSVSSEENGYEGEETVNAEEAAEAMVRMKQRGKRQREDDVIETDQVLNPQVSCLLI